MDLTIYFLFQKKIKDKRKSSSLIDRVVFITELDFIHLLFYTFKVLQQRKNEGKLVSKLRNTQM